MDQLGSCFGWTCICLNYLGADCRRSFIGDLDRAAALDLPNRDTTLEEENMIRLPFWFVVLAFIVSLPTLALAEPMVQFQQGDIKIVVHSEDCAYKNVVSNLPKRATWTEKGKVFEGCAGGNPDMGLILFYFAGDRTVAAVPMAGFTRLQGV
jgi:hypothetical protein